MYAHLMYREHGLPDRVELPTQAADLTKDLALDVLLDAMAGGDDFLRRVAETTLLADPVDVDTITYRQHVLRDCLAQPVVVADLYRIAVEAIEREHREYFPLLIRSPEPVLHRSVKVLEGFLEALSQLREISDRQADRFDSDGLRALLTTLSTELDDDFFTAARRQLSELHGAQGVLFSAGLGEGNKGARYLFHQPPHPRWWERLLATQDRSYSFQLPDRDIAGAQALAQLTGHGVADVANVVAAAVDHVLGFFRALRTELGFYIGAVRLAGALTARGEPTCFPRPLPVGADVFTCRGLYDPTLSLSVDHPVVGNDVDATARTLVVITGANEGGKSRFLRAVGLAHLMTQCGLFAPAHSLRTAIRPVHTHFTREEDLAMVRGRFDEELHRMSRIVDVMEPHALLLCNESFAATNEWEGSQIAEAVLDALRETGTTIFLVTHMYDLAGRLESRHDDSALFLRAGRHADGRRTFTLTSAPPLPTSYGTDLYRSVFGYDPAPSPHPPPASRRRPSP